VVPEFIAHRILNYISTDLYLPPPPIEAKKYIEEDIKTEQGKCYMEKEKEGAAM
jgi:hypothetical protein